ncbi:MAG: hypothetical protein EOO10_21660, partial [Chitinophagaceae bacterium]
MKRLILSLSGLLLLGYTQHSALAATKIAPTAPEDTIVITMPDKSKMMIYVKDKKDLAKFQKFNVDSLISSLSMYMNSGIESGADTTLRISSSENGDGNQVDIRVSGNGDPAQMRAIASLKRQVSLLDRSIATLDKQRSNSALSASDRKELSEEIQNLMKEKETVTAELATLQSASRKNNGTVSVRVDSNDKNGNKVITIGDNASRQDTVQKKFKPWYHEFELDLGFNTLVDRQLYEMPNGEMYEYSIKPFGSRYASLNWVTGSVIGGKGSPFRIQSGIQFNFNNFMWDNNIRIESEDNHAVFVKEDELHLSKSKLAVTYVTVPVMAGLQFKNPKGKDSFRFMAGGYAGYRLGTHSKI